MRFFWLFITAVAVLQLQPRVEAARVLTPVTVSAFAVVQAVTQQVKGGKGTKRRFGGLKKLLSRKTARTEGAPTKKGAAEPKRRMAATKKAAEPKQRVKARTEKAAKPKRPGVVKRIVSFAKRKLPKRKAVRKKVSKKPGAAVQPPAIQEPISPVPAGSVLSVGL